jgi:hypothetical protein
MVLGCAFRKEKIALSTIERASGSCTTKRLAEFAAQR